MVTRWPAPSERVKHPGTGMMHGIAHESAAPEALTGLALEDFPANRSGESVQVGLKDSVLSESVLLNIHWRYASVPG